MHLFKVFYTFLNQLFLCCKCSDLWDVKFDATEDMHWKHLSLSNGAVYDMWKIIFWGSHIATSDLVSMIVSATWLISTRVKVQPWRLIWVKAESTKDLWEQGLEPSLLPPWQTLMPINLRVKVPLAFTIWLINGYIKVVSFTALFPTSDDAFERLRPTQIDLCGFFFFYFVVCWFGFFLGKINLKIQPPVSPTP